MKKLTLYIEVNKIKNSIHSINKYYDVNVRMTSYGITQLGSLESITGYFIDEEKYIQNYKKHEEQYIKTLPKCVIDYLFYKILTNKLSTIKQKINE